MSNYFYEMPSIVINRIVQTKNGTAVVQAYNRMTNQIDVASPKGMQYGLKFEDVEVTPLLLKKVK